jgi:hypothetical protein
MLVKHIATVLHTPEVCMHQRSRAAALNHSLHIHWRIVVSTHSFASAPSRCRKNLISVLCCTPLCAVVCPARPKKNQAYSLLTKDLSVSVWRHEQHSLKTQSGKRRSGPGLQALASNVNTLLSTVLHAPGHSKEPGLAPF